MRRFYLKPIEAVIITKNIDLIVYDRDLKLDNLDNKTYDAIQYGIRNNCNTLMSYPEVYRLYKWFDLHRYCIDTEISEGMDLFEILEHMRAYIKTTQRWLVSNCDTPDDVVREINNGADPDTIREILIY